MPTLAELAKMFDHSLLQPVLTDAEMAKGHRAIEAYFKNSVQQLGDAKLKTVDLQSLGPGSAREVGTFNFKTKGDSPQDVVGKYVAVWRKMGGQWRLITDIWNTNK